VGIDRAVEFFDERMAKSINDPSLHSVKLSFFVSMFRNAFWVACPGIGWL
jgi:hypothetical protein